jgi:glycosyltransferase involved in cell wall biosynthesis
MEGISFLVRAHNEELTLEQSVRSLFGLLITYEILIFLNNCTDLSAAIAHRLAQENSNIRVFEYNVQLSRPGYEMLATDASSEHSLATFYNWSIKYAKYKWRVKWDADFLADPLLLNFIQSIDLREEAIIHLPAIDYDGDVESNAYMTSCLVYYMKDLFWEMPAYKPGCPHKYVGDVRIQHLSSVRVMKKYWFYQSWFEKEQFGAEAREVQYRMRRLVEDFGPEPLGLVRSGQLKDAVELGSKIMEHGPDYVARHT